MVQGSSDTKWFLTPDNEAHVNLLIKATISLAMISCFGCAVATVPKSSDKVAICHKGKTIYISEAAVKAHLKHGDYVGPCK